MILWEYLVALHVTSFHLSIKLQLNSCQQNKQQMFSKMSSKSTAIWAVSRLQKSYGETSLKSFRPIWSQLVVKCQVEDKLDSYSTNTSVVTKALCLSISWSMLWNCITKVSLRTRMIPLNRVSKIWSRNVDKNLTMTSWKGWWMNKKQDIQAQV